MVYEGDNDAGQVAVTGVLTIRPEDFMPQLTTMKVINATSAQQRLAATARFGQFFAGALFDVDCIFGKRAALDVYPLILEHLESTR
ncbi:MAG: hypothetical protein ACRDUV_06565 [Pseudonocardiaceae bacterium]